MIPAPRLKIIIKEKAREGEKIQSLFMKKKLLEGAGAVAQW
jgi:hypothetical protein